MKASNSPDEVFDRVLDKFGMFEPAAKYKIVCPFHADNNASLQVNRDTSYWYCYGCKKSGGALELIKYSNPGMSDITALKELRKFQQKYGDSHVRTHAHDNNYTSTKPNTSFVKTSYKVAVNQARDFYFNLPITNWYKPIDDSDGEIWFDVKSYMRKRGFKSKTLTKHGAKLTYNKYYPITFPLVENGVFRGYVMRTMDPQVEENHKYFYNKGFRRESCLPGEYKNTDTIVCVEGWLDKLKANQLGIEHVVAFLGWKATGTQLSRLKKSGIKVIICGLDNDECGDKGYRYLKRIAQSYDFVVKRLRYPKKIKDMGDLNELTADHILRQIKLFGGLIHG